MFCRPKKSIIILFVFFYFLFQLCFLLKFCSLYSDAGNQDRVVIQELIKTVAQSQQIQSSTQREFKGKSDQQAWK